MRTKYTLWKASNGWLLVPEGTHDAGIKATDAPNIVVFKSLEEFAKYSPKRVRNRKKVTQPKPTTKEPEHANLN